MNELFVRQYVPERDGGLEVNEREVWRYAGYQGIPPESEEELRDIFEEAVKDGLAAAGYKVVMRRFRIEWEGEMPALPFPSQSKGLARLLKGCGEGIMFAATVGMAFDRLIRRAQRVNTPKALLLQALGAERAESLCDRFCQEMREMAAGEGLSITPRYSPGYGDLPLTVQRDFMELLEMDKTVGISLGESLLMTPSKSVTAVFGLRPGAGGDEAEHGKCSECTKTDCEFRKA